MSSNWSKSNNFESALGVLELWNVFKPQILAKFAQEDALIESAEQQAAEPLSKEEADRERENISKRRRFELRKLREKVVSHVKLQSGFDIESIRGSADNGYVAQPLAQFDQDERKLIAQHDRSCREYVDSKIKRSVFADDDHFFTCLGEFPRFPKHLYNPSSPEATRERLDQSIRNTRSAVAAEHDGNQRDNSGIVHAAAREEELLGASYSDDVEDQELDLDGDANGVTMGDLGIARKIEERNVEFGGVMGVSSGSHWEVDDRLLGAWAWDLRETDGNGRMDGQSAAANNNFQDDVAELESVQLHEVKEALRAVGCVEEKKQFGGTARRYAGFFTYSERGDSDASGTVLFCDFPLGGFELSSAQQSASLNSALKRGACEQEIRDELLSKRKVLRFKICSKKLGMPRPRNWADDFVKKDQSKPKNLFLMDPVVEFGSEAAEKRWASVKTFLWRLQQTMARRWIVCEKLLRIFLRVPRYNWSAKVMELKQAILVDSFSFTETEEQGAGGLAEAEGSTKSTDSDGSGTESKNEGVLLHLVGRHRIISLADTLPAANRQGNLFARRRYDTELMMREDERAFCAAKRKAADVVRRNLQLLETIERDEHLH